MNGSTGVDHPHGRGSVRLAGRSVEDAGAAVILVHGRGGSAADILSLAPHLGRDDLAYLAPQARGNTWYPHSFLAPLSDNEPWLSSGLRRLSELVSEVEAKGIPASSILLLGFSQGACLTLEFLARAPRRYGGVVGLTGGLIGPPGTSREYAGSLEGTPVFLGSSDPDPHVPWSRVEETAEVLGRLGARVERRRYPGMGHTINEDELEVVRALIGAAVPVSVAGDGRSVAEASE